MLRIRSNYGVVATGAKIDTASQIAVMAVSSDKRDAGFPGRRALSLSRPQFRSFGHFSGMQTFSKSCDNASQTRDSCRVTVIVTESATVTLQVQQAISSQAGCKPICKLEAAQLWQLNFSSSTLAAWRACCHRDARQCATVH